ncbi:MAG: hypothetical protein P1U88_15270, partial [Thalassobaculaceae bacterium]|nr:hypothetical protein [Thalassobaculaceae bacterium]
MTTIFARRARLPDGWAGNVTIRISDTRITGTDTGAAPEA